MFFQVSFDFCFILSRGGRIKLLQHSQISGQYFYTHMRQFSVLLIVFNGLV